jgi:AsmA protein
MKQMLKWLLILIGGVLFLVVVALLVIPMFVDVQKYKPEIEERVSKALGRPLTIGGDLRLSLFPWAGVAFSDLRMGNPPGFEEKELLSVKSFDVRMKLLPLLSRDIQIKRFVVDSPRIVLERSSEGRANWEGLGKPAQKPPTPPPKAKARPPDLKRQEELPLIRALGVDRVTITNGSILFMDRAKGERREISDLDLSIQEASLHRSVKVSLSLRVNDLPFSLKGTLGPLGRDLAKGRIPLNFNVKAFEQVETKLMGEIIKPIDNPQVDLSVMVSPFSPRNLFAALGRPFPAETADSKVLTLMGFKAKLKGDKRRIRVSDGRLDLDESKLQFSFSAKDPSRPMVTFRIHLDKIDLDRYLPASNKAKGGKDTPAPEKGGKAQASGGKNETPSDYGPLKSITVDGAIQVERLKVQGARFEDLSLKISGRNGLFHLDPLTVNLYQGNAAATGSLDVQQDTPKTRMKLRAQGIRVGPLLKDMGIKDLLDGTGRADVSIETAGETVDRIRRNLNGKGTLVIKDGTVKGIDLGGMVRNVKAAFGLDKGGKQGARTDFSELRAPFTVTNGVVNTQGTTLTSPYLRVMAVGDADLVKETLDMRVEPKFAADVKMKGSRFTLPGIMIPVLVTGTFSSPRFSPDLKGIVTQGLEDEIKGLFKGKGKKKKEKDKSTSLEDKAKGLLKGLGIGK